MIGILSRGIARIEHLSVFLDEPWEFVSGFSAPSCKKIAGWGLKPSAEKARTYAQKYQLPYLSFEDGFLRSVGLGNDDPPLSISIDELGIYYDANRPSSLEALIASPITALQQQRARTLITKWRAGRVSKYNHAREFSEDLTKPYVLAVDQTFGDASLAYGIAGPASFEHMLDAALAENPDCEVWLKVHPEVMAGHKQGHFDLAALTNHPRIRILAHDVHPVRLIEHTQAVYVVTSQMGFEGLLWGKKVRTFGMPFYAGWGLTEDELPPPARRHAVDLENLVHAALVAYPRYIDPETHERCEVERVLDYLALQRHMMERFPASMHALAFSEWKKPIVRKFFHGSDVTFHRSADEVPQQSILAVWGRKPFEGSLHDDITVVRLEDGFLRSVGLGAELIQPLSWVMDRSGIYYDATTPSDLEHILQHTHFNELTIERAEVLRTRLVAQGLTKYNVGQSFWKRPDQRNSDANSTRQQDTDVCSAELQPSLPKVILVPGQVESDASLAYGAPGIRKNLDLLKAVRLAHPDAYIVYKPHPDVVAGLREQGESEEKAADWCNEVVVDASMGVLLPNVDEVHTLTSLTGFEALLRGKKVVCYGQPFYSGWGLTHDMLPPARRTRQLSLDALVAGVLIHYPVYVSRTTGRFTTPERALDELLLWRAAVPVRVPLWRRVFRNLLGFSKVLKKLRPARIRKQLKKLFVKNLESKPLS